MTFWRVCHAIFRSLKKFGVNSKLVRNSNFVSANFAITNFVIINFVLAITYFVITNCKTVFTLYKAYLL